jgi:hypothetical protein
MEQIVAYVKPLKDFSKDSMRLVKRCTKPDLKGKPLIDFRCEMIFCWQNFKRLLLLHWLDLPSWASLGSL